MTLCNTNHNAEKVQNNYVALAMAIAIAAAVLVL